MVPYVLNFKITAANITLVLTLASTWALVNQICNGTLGTFIAIPKPNKSHAVL